MKKLKEIFMGSSIAPIIIGVIVGFIIAGVIIFFR
jgi:cytochrome bd-type quinol oxidase subunit 2